MNTQRTKLKDDSPLMSTIYELMECAERLSINIHFGPTTGDDFRIEDIENNGPFNHFPFPTEFKAIIGLKSYVENRNV